MCWNMQRWRSLLPVTLLVAAACSKASGPVEAPPAQNTDDSGTAVAADIEDGAAAPGPDDGRASSPIDVEPPPDGLQGSAEDSVDAASLPDASTPGAPEDVCPDPAVSGPPKPGEPCAAEGEKRCIDKGAYAKTLWRTDGKVDACIHPSYLTCTSNSDGTRTWHEAACNPGTELAAKCGGYSPWTCEDTPAGASCGPTSCNLGVHEIGASGSDKSVGIPISICHAEELGTWRCPAAGMPATYRLGCGFVQDFATLLYNPKFEAPNECWDACGLTYTIVETCADLTCPKAYPDKDWPPKWPGTCVQDSPTEAHCATDCKEAGAPGYP